MKTFRIEIISRDSENWVDYIVPADAIKSAADFETESLKAFKTSEFNSAEVIFYAESSSNVTGWRRIRKIYLAK